MPVAFVGAGGVSLATSFSFGVGTPGTNRLVTVFALDEILSPQLTGITVDGKACTVVHAIVNINGIGNLQELWYIDEAGLGASSGSVTVAITGGNADYAISAMLHTGVSQAGPNDSNFNDTELTGPTIPVTGIDVSAGGLVVAGYGQGQGALTLSSVTSPLAERDNQDAGGGADLFVTSGIEATVQVAKTYTATMSAVYNRATGIAASWDAAPEVLVHQMLI